MSYDRQFQYAVVKNTVPSITHQTILHNSRELGIHIFSAKVLTTMYIVTLIIIGVGFRE